MVEGSSAIFREDRSWMYTGRRSRDSITPEWAEKTTEFVERAFRRVSTDHAARGVLCPCARCGNTRPQSKYDMQMHLCKNGFRPGYTVWVYHGESPSRRPAEPSDDQPDEKGGLEGMEDAELADFWGEEEEVSSKPQGAMKREIPLIQAYAYSKLRKEDQIEWDYEKYLWEKQKLPRQQEDAPERLAQVEAQLENQHLAAKRCHLDYDRFREHYRHFHLAYEKNHQQTTEYQEYINSFMAAMHSHITCGTPLPKMRQAPPLPIQLPILPSIKELMSPATCASGTPSLVNPCTVSPRTSCASTSHKPILVRAFRTNRSIGINTHGQPCRASLSALEAQLEARCEEQSLVYDAYDILIEHHNLANKTIHEQTTKHHVYREFYMDAFFSHKTCGTPMPPMRPPPPLPTRLPLMTPMAELMPPTSCASGTRGPAALNVHLGGGSTPASRSLVTPRTGGASMSR